MFAECFLTDIADIACFLTDPALTHGFKNAIITLLKVIRYLANSLMGHFLHLFVFQRISVCLQQVSTLKE